MTFDLDQLFAPCTADEFLLEHYGLKFLHARGPAGRFSDLLPLDSPQSKALAQSLEYTLEAPGSLRQTSEAIEPCRAKHDLIVLQTSGAACWRIFKTGSELEEPVWESRLEDGGALYVPGAAWYAAEEGGERLEISIESPTAADLLLWVAKLVQDIEVFQTPIPRFAAPAARAAYMAGVRANLRLFLRRPALLEHYRASLNSTVQSHCEPGIPWSPELSDDHVVVLDTMRPPRIEETSAASIALSVNGEQFLFGLDAAPLLYFLVDRAPVAVGEFLFAFQGEFERDELLDFIGALFGKGVVHFRPPREHST